MVRLDESKITSQGQISIPKKIRAKLQLEPGDKVIFWEDEKNGCIILRGNDWPTEFTPQDWKKFLAKVDREPTTRYTNVEDAIAHLDRLAAKSKSRKK